MDARDALSVLSALIDDVDAMREHDARLTDFQIRSRMAAALRTLAQSEACRRATSRQTSEATRLFLEHEVGRPRPPDYVGRDAVLWAIVRDHLAARLRALPSG